MEEKKIINSLYEKYYELLEQKDILENKEIYFDNIFKIEDKIKISRYLNFIYSYRGDKFLNNMNEVSINNFFDIYSKDDVREIYNIFQISANLEEKFFEIFSDLKIKNEIFWDSAYSFLLTKNDNRIKFIELLYVYYFLILDYFNNYNIYYIFNFKSSNKYLYSGIYFKNFINPKFSNNTIFYLNLSRFISTSYNQKTAEGFYFGGEQKQIPITSKLLFKFDINKIKKYCKIFDFNNDLCINFEQSEYTVKQQKDKLYIKEHSENLNKTILLYSIYKTINPDMDFQTFYNLKKDEPISFSYESYIDILNKDINFDELYFKDEIIRLDNRLPYNKETHSSELYVYKDKLFSCCSLYDEEEVLLLPNEDIFIKIDYSKINSYKSQFYQYDNNIFCIEDNEFNDLFITSDELIKSINGGSNSLINNKPKNVFVNFTFSQLNKIYNKEKLINKYSNNEIIYTKLYDDDFQYKINHQDFLKNCQNINLQKDNNLLKGGEDYYKQKYLNYKYKYLNLKNKK